MRIIESLLNILFPPECVSCKAEGDFLCDSCIKKLKIKKIRKNVKKTSSKEFKYLDGVIYGLDYAKNPQIQAAIQQFKYKFTQELKDIFADLIADKLKQLSMVRGRRIVLIPVPLHRKRYFKRGFNQAYLIAKAVQEKIGGRVDVPSVLKRDVNTPQQAKLSKGERHKNLKDAFSLNKNCVQTFNQKSVYFIVDDVCTTGTTLESCAKVLKEAGISRVYGLVVARAMKR